MEFFSEKSRLIKLEAVVSCKLSVGEMRKLFEAKRTPPPPLSAKSTKNH